MDTDVTEIGEEFDQDLDKLNMTLKDTVLDVKNLTNTVENNIQNVSSLDDNISKFRIIKAESAKGLKSGGGQPVI